MKSFKSYLFREAYKEVRKLGDRLAKIEPLIDWEAFRPLITPLYDNKDPKGGRPNLDEVMMVKLLVLQQWYGLSDPELERQAADRLSFRRFLGFPERRSGFSGNASQRRGETGPYGRSSSASLTRRASR